MKTVFKRSEEIEDKIKNIKLPYLEWKVLFVIGENTTLSEIEEITGADANEIQQALSKLEEKGLISEAAVSEETISETETSGAEESTVVSMPESLMDAEEDKIEVPDEGIVNGETVEAAPAFEEDETDTDREAEQAESDEFSAGQTGSELPREEEPAGLEAVEEEEEKDALSELLSEDAGEAESDKTEAADEQKEAAEESGGAEADSMTDFLQELNGLTSEEKPVVEPPGKTEEAAISSATEELMEVAEEPEAEAVPDEITAEEQKQTSDSGHEVEEIVTDGSAKRILVIDDSIVIRKMVEIALEEEDYEILSVVSGKAGLEMIDEKDPGLVIVDLMLPDMSGVDVLKAVKSAKDIPVIMLSGKDTPQSIETARNEGADDFLPKPFKDEELVQKVKSLFS